MQRNNLPLLSLLTLVLLGLIYSVKPSNADTARNAVSSKPVVQATSVQVDLSVSPFFEYLKQQAKKHSALYIVEGEPAREVVVTSPSLAEKGLEALSLPEVATQYGYRAETLQSGIVIFHKTYCDERDLPSVTLEEWLAAIKDMENIINTASPKIDLSKSNSVAEGIMKTFKAEQFAAMQRGKAEGEAWKHGNQPPANGTMASGGQPVSGLSAHQKAEVWRVARFIHVQNSLVEAERYFNQSNVVLGGAAPVFTFQEIKKVRLFGYEIKTPPAGETRFLSLSNPYQFNSGLGGTRPIMGRVISSDSPQTETRPAEGEATFLVSPQNDPTTPASKNILYHSALAVSIKQLFDLINGENSVAPSKKASAKLFVKEELAGKRVAYVGDLPKANPVDVARAIAVIYGLRLVNTGNEATLNRPRARITENPSYVGAALEEMIPLPYIKAYNRTIREDDPAKQKVSVGGHAYITTDVETVGLRWNAIMRLRQTVEKKAESAPDKRVALTDLDDKEKQAFATILMSTCLKPLLDFAKKPVPNFISDFDNSILMGSVENGQDGKPWLTLFVGRRLPNGNLVQEAGFSSPVSFR